MSATHQTECWCGEQHRWGPMEVALCDSDGIVRRGAMHRGTDYECTGSAHWSGFHIRCTSPAHVPAGVPVTGAVPDRRQDERACTTIGCENPGTVTGTFHDGDDEYRVVYCRRHATLLGDAFTPDEPAVSQVPDALRQAVADELARHQGLRGPMDDNRPDVWQNRCNCGWDDGDERPGWRDRYRLHVADAVIAVLNGPQSPPSHAGRAEGGGRMYSGGPSVEVTSQDETEGRR